jgi:hypothetical protein
MSLLNFLKSGTVEVLAEAPKGAGGKPKQWGPNPTLIAVRVWRDGSVFPSQAAVDKFDLEYKKATVKIEDVPARAEEKDETGKVTVTAREASKKRTYEYEGSEGNGLDIISSLEWKEFNSSVDGKMIFVAVTPKKEPKVDLFASTNYNDDGTPKANVLEQGAVTFGKTVLLPMLKDVYEIELSEEEGKDFVDMVIFETLGSGVSAMDVTGTFSRPIVFLPKRIVRGDAKGKLDYARREGVKIYGFAPAAMVDEVEKATGVGAAQQESIALGVEAKA